MLSVGVANSTFFVLQLEGKCFVKSALQLHDNVIILFNTNLLNTTDYFCSVLNNNCC